jgi:hypothetical protein
MRRSFMLAVALLFSAAGVCFAETTLKAELDKKVLTTDETVTYKLTVTSSEKKLSVPQFPDFKGFSILSSAQSSSFSLSSEGAKTMLVYVFVLMPDEPGSLTIAPVEMTIAGKKTVSEGFTLNVAAGKGRIRKPQSPKEPGPRKRLPPDLGHEPQYEL